VLLAVIHAAVTWDRKPDEAETKIKEEPAAEAEALNKAT
jgi:hypothetical protein